MSALQTSHEITARITAFQTRLLRWYQEHARDLPWRRTQDPYRILVAEIMLQQTQVNRVIPKYEEFCARFPDLRSLADAPRAEVIRIWAPLGYNRRAVHLHEVALRLHSQGVTKLPSDIAELRKLPGIGEYTAAAIACFAYGQSTPVVDTNVRRVVLRVMADFAGNSPAAGAIRSLAQRCLAAEYPGAWSQALMDLGATICVALRPRCDQCPVVDVCASAHYASGGAIERAAGVAEHGVPYRAAAPFAGSNRFFRGRILTYLRMLGSAESAAIEAVGEAIHPDWCQEREAWLLELFQALERDGLVSLLVDDWGRARVSLP